MPALQALNHRHFMIAHLLAQGKPRSTIVKRLNVSPATIQNCLDTPEFQETLDALKQEYAEKLSEQVILPFAEMQARLNQEALGALSRVVDISQSERGNSTVLNANLALLDRASNTPKASKTDPGEAPRDLFNVSVVQLVLETALQVGDKSILHAAQSALRQIPVQDASHLPPIDIESIPGRSKEPSSSPFALKSFDQVLQEAQEEEEDT